MSREKHAIQISLPPDHMRQDHTAQGQEEDATPVKTGADRYRMIMVIIGLVAVHALVLGYFSMRTSSKGAIVSPEVTLGEFGFAGHNVSEGAIGRASFRLHVSLLRETERDARGLLAAHQHKVQQEIEQLLRQANSGDFEDPLLSELKRQLQELINRTLGKRVVAEAIITDLSLERIAGHPSSPTGAAERPGKESPPARSGL